MGIIKMKYVTLLLVLAAVRGTDAATYVVGDSVGWTVPTGGAAMYATWAAKHTYSSGDILVFNFAAGAHDVATVTKDSFNSCSSTSPLALQTISPANVTLTTTGAHYFICTFSQHCSLGQKLTVNVTSTSAGPPASPPTAATPPTAAAPSSPPTAATPPTAAAPSSPPTAASPTTPPTAPAPVTPPAASPAPKGSAPAPGPTAGGGSTPAASPGPGGSASVPSPAAGGGPTPPSSPTPATPPGSSTSPPPPPSSASRKAVATLGIGLVLAVMGVVC